ncbi:MAG TPA: hypothetical protein VKE96_16670 [Vicinamibacterales bacterium]|nr:hypothetical protein [Vicinamibacterales bacterium]
MSRVTSRRLRQWDRAPSGVAGTVESNLDERQGRRHRLSVLATARLSMGLVRSGAVYFRSGAK